MSSAVRSIVEIYVNLKDRKAIEELRDHRHKLRSRLVDQSNGWFDTSHLMGVIDGDLRAIEAALSRL